MALGTRRKGNSKPKPARSDTRKALKRRLAMKYVRGQRASGRQASRMGDDD